MSTSWEKVLKIITVVVIIAVTFIVPLLIQSYFSSNTNQNTESLTITSLPISSIAPGETFEYAVQFKYTGQNPVLIQIEQKPDWLEWDQEFHIIKGVVPENITKFQFVVKAKTITTEHIQNVEIEVKKASSPTPVSENPITDELIALDTTKTWQDPFHPRIDTQVVAANSDQVPDGAVLGTKTATNNIVVIYFIGIMLTSLVLIIVASFLKKENYYARLYKRNGLNISVSHDKDY
jgi:hypothetical protein